MNPRPNGKLIPRISKEDIQSRIRMMSRQVAYDYSNTPCVLVPVMTGGLMLCADVIRHIGERSEKESTAKEIVLLPLDAGSYGPHHVSEGVLLARPKWEPSRLKGEHVLICDDIVDSGRTLRAVYEFIKREKPSSISLVALLDKRVQRDPLPELKKYEYGFEISDFWVVGYGLDQDGYYRGLPNICEYVEKGASEKPGFWCKPGGPM